MTDLQDLILDKLMGAKIGVNWADGPLFAAAQAINPRFELAPSRDRYRQEQLCKEVGFPFLFGGAFHGANAGLSEEDDRRSLAVAVFSAVEPGKPLKRRPYAQSTFAQNREVVAWMALRAHALVCPQGCPLQQAVQDLWEAFQQKESLNDPFQARSSCPRYTGWAFRPISRSCTPAHSSVVALRYLVLALRTPKPTLACADCARESARTEAKVAGVKGAADLLLELARKLEL
jgi:hypothetical protein